MAIDWDDNTKRKAFREALQKAYPNASALEMFVDEELNENLAVVAGGANLQGTAYGLVQWARAKGRMNEVYEAFKQQNPKHPVIEELERQSFILQKFNLIPDDWDRLFKQFHPNDLADLQRAFQKGFHAAFGITFWQAQPQHPPIIEIIQIRELLEIYDANDKGPLLAVRFVDYAIAELCRSSEGTQRDVTDLEQWRDRIAQAHNISPTSVDPPVPSTRHGYLLVALKESGRQTKKDGVFVTVSAELHITGESKPIEFENHSGTYSLASIAQPLFELIRNAERALIPYECGEVTLELFLPCTYLEENVALWEANTEEGDPRTLGMHRRFLVRSLERAMDPVKQIILKNNWQLLTTYVQLATVCEKFHCQENCPSPGALKGLLDSSPGLQLLSELPADQSLRIRILRDIIDSAVPIALWTSLSDAQQVAELKEQLRTLFAELLKAQITNFADLARTWLKMRAGQPNKAVEHIRLLCDCPDRWPSLPDSNQEEDLLIAS